MLLIKKKYFFALCFFFAFAAPQASFAQDPNLISSQEGSNPYGGSNEGPFFKVNIDSIDAYNTETGKKVDISVVISHDLNGQSQDFLIELKVAKRDVEVFSTIETMEKVPRGVKKEFSFVEKWTPEMPGDYTVAIKVFSPDMEKRYNAQKVQLTVTEKALQPRTSVDNNVVTAPPTTPSQGQGQADDTNTGKKQDKIFSLDLGENWEIVAIAVALIFGVVIMTVISMLLKREPA